MRIVCHAGEIGGPESVREAIEILGAERIGHGIAVMHDPALAASLATRRVVLEICPTSNICTGALAKPNRQSRCLARGSSAAEASQRGIPVTLSTDDPAMFHTDLLTEYSHAASLGLSNAPARCSSPSRAFTLRFCRQIEKRKLLEDFRAAAKSAGLL